MSCSPLAYLCSYALMQATWKTFVFCLLLVLNRPKAVGEYLKIGFVDATEVKFTYR